MSTGAAWKPIQAGVPLIRARVGCPLHSMGMQQGAPTLRGQRAAHLNSVVDSFVVPKEYESFKIPGVCSTPIACVSMIETVWPVFRLIAQQITELGASGLEVERKRLLFGVTEIRGGWSWHLSSLNVVPHWNSVQGICFQCGVTRMDDESGYTHFNSGAAWIGHEYSNAEFLANMLKPGLA